MRDNVIKPSVKVEFIVNFNYLNLICTFSFAILVTGKMNPGMIKTKKYILIIVILCGYLVHLLYRYLTMKDYENINQSENMTLLQVGENTWVTNAYLDRRPKLFAVIRIIAISLLNTRDIKNFYCIIGYDNGKVKRVKTSFHRFAAWLPMEKPFMHFPYYINCQNGEKTVPKWVSITREENTQTKNTIPVLSIPLGIPPDKIALFVRTIYGLNKPYRLIEFVEIHRLMGVDKIFVYDAYSISYNVHSVLNYYQKTGYVQVIKWTMDPDSMSVRAFGQIGGINDCLMRTMGRFKYLAAYDLDEVIVPRNATSWRPMLHDLERTHNNVAGFVFTQAHFCINHEHIQSKIISLSATQREPNYLTGIGPKAIAISNRVYELGVHDVNIPFTGFDKSHHVAPKIAVLHHYRQTSGTKLCTKTDREVVKWSEKLRTRMNGILTDMGLTRV